MKNNDVSAKVTAAGAGGALATIVVWVLGTFNIAVQPDVAAALATLLAFAGGYVARDMNRDKGTGNAAARMPVEEPNTATPTPDKPAA